MVVVGIVGVLVSLATPQYEKYQRRSKQAEAKIALGAIYGLERAFYSEYGAYLPAFNGIGYTPEGGKRWYYHSICHTDSWAGTVTNYNGATYTTSYGAQNNPVTMSWSYQTGHTCAIKACSTYGSDPQSFVASATGQLASGLRVDSWEINETKQLKNCSVGF